MQRNDSEAGKHIANVDPKANGLSEGVNQQLIVGEMQLKDNVKLSDDEMLKYAEYLNDNKHQLVSDVVVDADEDYLNNNESQLLDAAVVDRNSGNARKNPLLDDVLVEGNHWNSKKYLQDDASDNHWNSNENNQ